MQYKKCRCFVILSVAALLISCISVCFMNMTADAVRQQEKNTLLYVNGGIFWMGLILTYVFTWLAALCRKRGADRKIQGSYSRYPGMFCFFSSREAAVMDIVMIISIVSVVLTLVLDITNALPVFGSIICTLFSVHMHAILNGGNYRCLKAWRKQEMGVEDKKSKKGRKNYEMEEET